MYVGMYLYIHTYACTYIHTHTLTYIHTVTDEERTRAKQDMTMMYGEITPAGSRVLAHILELHRANEVCMFGQEFECIFLCALVFTHP